MTQIELINLTKSYPVGDATVSGLDAVSLSIEKGDFLSIVGHSGSGKTTLISIIGGILRPTSGKVLFNGEDICAMNDAQLSVYRSTKIGFMFQFASLLPILTARENVLLSSLFSPERTSDENERAVHYLELVGIGDKLDAYPGQLSGGQQRRVAIARALMNDPELILADEPTGDLDEETERDIMQLFKEINREKKVTMILITHNVALARGASRMMRMSQGRLMPVAAEMESDAGS
jgi:ABC-type lipoprotein export system ATPase subunit